MPVTLPPLTPRKAAQYLYGISKVQDDLMKQGLVKVRERVVRPDRRRINNLLSTHSSENPTIFIERIKGNLLASLEAKRASHQAKLNTLRSKSPSVLRGKRMDAKREAVEEIKNTAASIDNDVYSRANGEERELKKVKVKSNIQRRLKTTLNEDFSRGYHEQMIRKINGIIQYIEDFGCSKN